MEGRRELRMLQGQAAVSEALKQLDAMKGALRRPVAEGLQALVEAAYALMQAAAGAGTAAHDGELRLLKRLLPAVARALGSFQPYPATQGPALDMLSMHFEAMCGTVNAMSTVAVALGAKLAPAEAAQLAVSLSPVLRNAPGLLSAHTAAARRNPVALDTLARVLWCTLDASQSKLHMLEGAGAAEQLYASSVFSADVVVPFLQALTDGLEVALAAECTQPVKKAVMFHFTRLLYLVLRQRGFAHVVASLGARPALCDAIAGMLLAHVLPVAAAGLPAVGGRTHSVLAAAQDGSAGLGLSPEDIAAYAWVHEVAGLLTTPEMLPGVERHMHLPGAAAAVRHAALVLRAVPRAAPAGWSHDDFGAVLYRCTSLMSTVAYHASSRSFAGEAGRAAGSGSDSGSNSDSDSHSPAAAARVAERQQAAWHLVGAVPALAAIVWAAAADTQLRPALVKILAYLPLPMSLLEDLPEGLDSPAQLAALTVAAGEAARLVPLLTRMGEQWPELLEACPPEQRAALAAREGLGPIAAAVLLRRHLWYDSACVAYNWTRLVPELWQAVGGDGEQVLAALPAALWQAHSSSCRLLHHMAGCPTHVLVEGGGVSADWRITRQTVDLWFCTAVRVTVAAIMQPRQGLPASQAGTQVRAMCAAHWAAMQAGAAAVHTLQPLAPEPDANPHGSFGPRSDALLIVCQQHPLLLAAPDAQGRSPLDVLMAELQASGTDPVQSVLPRLLRHAGVQGRERLAVALLDGGWVALAMRQASLSSAGSMPPALQDGYPLHILQHVADASQHAADELQRQGLASIGASSSSAAGEGGAGAGVGDAAGTNLSCDPSAQAGRATSAVSEQPADLRAQLLSAAAQLRELARQRDAEGLHAAEHAAALLQRFWALPQQVEAARVELAQAAVARSCANLRCANAELGGGPAVGEGLGSKRCSGCRVAWYCGTTCSHADWRAGGHKQVCKLLASAGPVV